MRSSLTECFFLKSESAPHGSRICILKDESRVCNDLTSAVVWALFSCRSTVRILACV